MTAASDSVLKICVNGSLIIGTTFKDMRSMFIAANRFIGKQRPFDPEDELPNADKDRKLAT